MNFKQDKDRFIREIEERRIEYLVHFTKIDNLVGIFGRGKIISRSAIDKIGTRLEYFRVRDEKRYDNKPDYISLSIQHPNYYMLNRKQQEEGGFWCVILIDKKYIYCEDTVFSISNAASNFAQEVGLGGNFEDFINLFKDVLDKKTCYGEKRLTRDSLPACYPTCIQAEVLVKDNILCEDIIKVCFNDISAIELAERKIRHELADVRNRDIRPVLKLFVLDNGFWREQRG